MDTLRTMVAAGAIAALAALLPAAGSCQPRGADASVATVKTPATLTVSPIPRSVGNLYLEITVASYTPPPKGAVEAVVLVGPGSEPPETEVGRFAIFPHAAFEARQATEQRRYRFNVTQAVAAIKPEGRPLLVQVRLVPIDGTAAVDSAAMTISRAALSSE